MNLGAPSLSWMFVWCFAVISCQKLESTLVCPGWLQQVLCLFF